MAAPRLPVKLLEGAQVNYITAELRNEVVPEILVNDERGSVIRSATDRRCTTVARFADWDSADFCIVNAAHSLLYQ